MTRLPVIVGFGGFNAAGRSSFHHAYRRTVLDSLDKERRDKTLLGLACMMALVDYQDGGYQDKEGNTLTPQQVVEKFEPIIRENTLVRRIHPGLFDVTRVSGNRDVDLSSDASSEFTLSRRDLPSPIPENWQVETLDDKSVKVTIKGDLSVKMESFRELQVQSAGILPTGFEPAEHYKSHFHPRGLQMSILGASDAINSIGIPWQTILDSIHPDEIAVFASSCLGQLDEYSLAGYLQARLKSSRPSTKQMAFSFTSMPTDFVNAYVCGTVGTTGAVAGACATFLYNLRLAVDDIAAGKLRVAVVGSSEAPVTSEIIEAFAAMNALGTDERIAKLDAAEQTDHRRASRPFGENCGFTIGESSQYFVIMDDALAIELGAQIYGAVPSVHVNSDGFKKSISAPGAGNYITLAKAVASAQTIVGDEAIQQRSFIQAHGSSTPQNRVTESTIFDKVANAFDIQSWPVTAVKAFVGHPLAPASGDQLANSLGVFADGIIPGIKTTEKVADDVVDANLDILLSDKNAQMDVAFLNSKGFGGNNASAVVLAPYIVESMLEKRYSASEFKSYQQKKKGVNEQALNYENDAINANYHVIYKFGEGIISDEEIDIDANSVSIKAFSQSVDLTIENPYKDMV